MPSILGTLEAHNTMLQPFCQ